MQSPLTSHSHPHDAAGREPAAELRATRGRVILSGYYGYNNLGDEAILTAIVQQLRSLEPDLGIVALSGDPARTSRALGVESIHRLDMPGIFQALREASLFISGGGSLLQDVTGLGSVPYYLGLVKMAQLLKVRTMFLGQGIGPLNLPTSRWMVGQVARQLDAIAVRDQGSRELLASCGVPIDRITLTADPVLALDPAPAERVDAIWRSLGLEAGKPVIAVAIRPWSDWFERQLKAFSAVLAQQATAWNAQILLLPFHRPDDEALNEELRYCLETRPDEHRPHVVELEEPLMPDEMIGLLARVDLLVGMRLHALIMAAASAVPSVGLVYDPKVKAFADLAGFPTISSVSALEDSSRLDAVLTSVWADREGVRAALRDKQTQWRGQALRNAELAIDCVRNAHVRHA